MEEGCVMRVRKTSSRGDEVGAWASLRFYGECGESRGKRIIGRRVYCDVI